MDVLKPRRPAEREGGAGAQVQPRVADVVAFVQADVCVRGTDVEAINPAVVDGELWHAVRATSRRHRNLVPRHYRRYGGVPILGLRLGPGVDHLEPGGIASPFQLLRNFYFHRADARPDYFLGYWEESTEAIGWRRVFHPIAWFAIPGLLWLGALFALREREVA